MSAVSRPNYDEEAASLRNAIAAADVRIAEGDRKFIALQQDLLRTLEEQNELSRLVLQQDAEHEERVSRLREEAADIRARQQLIRQQQRDRISTESKVCAAIMGVLVLGAIGIGITYGFIKFV